jgi:hypothetical protein
MPGLRTINFFAPAESTPAKHLFAYRTYDSKSDCCHKGKKTACDESSPPTL